MDTLYWDIVTDDFKYIYLRVHSPNYIMQYNAGEIPFSDIILQIEIFTFLDKNSGAEAKRLSRRRTGWTKCFQRA